MKDHLSYMTTFYGPMQLSYKTTGLNISAYLPSKYNFSLGIVAKQI